MNILGHGINPKDRSTPQGQHLSAVNGNIDSHFVALWEPDSLASEKYRELRTYLLEIARKKESKVFLVTSAVHSEGKTLTAINLAITLARGLQETALLIDADLRKPNISNIFGYENGRVKGLAEYITSGGDLADLIVKTSIPKLSIIPAGLPPENPSELVNSKRMSDLIAEVKHRYDNRFIIIDSPPLTPITDAAILSSLVDKIIIVIKASITPKKMVNDAIDKIEDKEKILGLVLNGYRLVTKCKYAFN